MSFSKSSGFVSLASLCISALALMVVGTQTLIQWTASAIPLQANLQVLQLQSCTVIIEKLLKFSNNNAEQRLILAEIFGTAPEGISVSSKADSAHLPKTQTELQLTLNRRKETSYDLAEELNIALLSHAHLFPPADRAILTKVLHSIVPLLTEPEGATAATPTQLNENIESFRASCKVIGAPLMSEP